MCVTLKKIVLLLLFIFVCLQDYVLAVRREFPTCRSGDGCIRLTNCLPYMNLIKSLKKPLTRAAVLFLRKQECGFDGTYPMVCCFQSNMRRTQNNRFNSLEEKGFSTKPPPYYSHNHAEEEPEEIYHHSKRPDLTPSDLSDYRFFKFQDTNKEFLFETSSPKSTTERAKTTTRLYRRRVNYILNGEYTNGVTTAQPTQNEEVKNKRAEEMKKKVQAINHAFMYSTMDYFFLRRMDDQKSKGKEKEKKKLD